MVIELTYDKYEDSYVCDELDLCREGLSEFLDLGNRVPKKLLMEINAHPYHDRFEFVVVPATLHYEFRSGYVSGICVDWQFMCGSELFEIAKHYCKVFGVDRLYVTFYR